MDIRIEKLTLENFKGARNVTYDFKGTNVRVDGENGTGKSTIFDAFTWLLFGKDRNGNDQTKFDIKTIDPETLKPFEKVDHSVEAVLLVDGTRQTLKRIWRENWVKPKGEVEQVMKGHSTLFFVNGVDVATKKAYDDVIHQWISEDVFKHITDPLYFIGDRTHWKARRDVLMAMVSGMVDTASIREQYADLIKEMNGENMDSFRRRINTQRRENMKALEEREHKIAAYKETLPEDESREQIEESKKSLKDEEQKELQVPHARIADIDARMADIAKENEAVNAEVKKIYEQVTELQLKQSRYLSEGLKQAQEENGRKSMAVIKARQEFLSSQGELSETSNAIESLQRKVQDYQQDRAELAADLAKMGEKFKEEKAKTFAFVATTKCHACGQDLPAETVEEATRKAREAFESDQKKTVASIVDKAQKIKDDIEKADRSIEAKRAEIESCRKVLEDKQKKLTEAAEAYEKAKAEPLENLDKLVEQLKREQEYVEMSESILSLQDRAGSMKGEDHAMAGMKEEKARALDDIKAINDKYREMMKPLDAKLVELDIRKNTLSIIEKAEAEVKKLANEIARLEVLEYQALAYIKADVEAQETAINRLFKVARWKMFDYTLDGGVVETCEVMTREGASFSSMNDAAKIQCGMDCIRAISQKVNCWATIFIDNAESITQKEFDTTAQVVRLRVQEGTELTVSAE